jgi:hypothetical protein
VRRKGKWYVILGIVVDIARYIGIFSMIDGLDSAYENPVIPSRTGIGQNKRK